MLVPALGPLAALRRHWPEYAIEGWALGMFMVSASVATVLLYDPRSPAFHLIENEFWKRALMALAMAGTAVAIIYSRWGKRSGAHINPGILLDWKDHGCFNIRGDAMSSYDRHIGAQPSLRVRPSRCSGKPLIRRTRLSPATRFCQTRYSERIAHTANKCIRGEVDRPNGSKPFRQACGLTHSEERRRRGPRFGGY